MSGGGDGGEEEEFVHCSGEGEREGETGVVGGMRGGGEEGERGRKVSRS